MTRARRVEGELNEAVERLETVEREVGFARRDANRMKKCTEYVFQNATAIENLYMETVQTPNGGGWRKMKEQLKVTLQKQFVEHLQLPFPFPAETQRVGEEWVKNEQPTEKKEMVAAVEQFIEAFGVELIQNINAQTRKAANDGRSRIEGTFTVVIAYEIEALMARQAVRTVLERATRKYAGMPVRNFGNAAASVGDTIPVEQLSGSKFLVYNNKTPEERDRKRKRDEGAAGKGDGPGGAKGAKGKGKSRRGRGQT